MTEVADWDKIDEKNLALDDLGLSNSRGAHWQKMMGAIARMFTKFPTELGGEVDVTHLLVAESSPRSKTYELAVNICDGDGSWLSAPIKATFELTSQHNASRGFKVNFGADGPGGCSICYPYSAVVPSSADTSGSEYYRDTGVFFGAPTNHFVQTLSDGAVVELSLSTDPEYPDSGSKKILNVKIYAPDSLSPRQFEVDVDGTPQLVTLNDTAFYEGYAEVEISGTTIGAYGRRSKSTRIYAGEDISALAPTTLTAEPFTSEYLGFSLTRTANGVGVTVPEADISSWGTTLAANLKVTTEKDDAILKAETVSLADIVAWVSSEDARVLQYVNDRLDALEDAVAELGEGGT